jgi:hypothetical protein
MDIEELYKYAYIKRPLNHIYPELSSVPQEFIMEWFKDTYDYQRIHSDEELKEFLLLTPAQIMKWLEEAIVFTWEIKKQQDEKAQ